MPPGCAATTIAAGAPTQSAAKNTGRFSSARKMIRHRLEAELRFGPALRTSQVRGEDHGRALTKRVFDRRQCGADSGVVANCAVDQIGTMKSTRMKTRRFLRGVRESIAWPRGLQAFTGHEVHKGRRSGSSSPTRCRKCQAITLRKSPSMIFVCAASIIAECGLTAGSRSIQAAP